MIDFWGLVYDLAKRMGLLNETDRVGYHVRNLRVVGDHCERLAGFGTTVFEELIAGRYFALARRDLLRLLLATAAPSTDGIFGDKIVSRIQGADCVNVHLRGGSARHFDLVAGADGLHSQMRWLAFGPDERFEKPVDYVVAAFEAQHYQPGDLDIYMIYGVPERRLGRSTLRDNRSLFLFVFVFEGALPTTLYTEKTLGESLYRADGWECPKILRQLEETEEL